MGVVSPLLLATFSFLGNSDIYWIAGWCALVCLPVLMLFASRRWSGRSIAACAGVAIVASYASSIRSEAGLGVATAAVALVLVRERKWRRRLAVGALVAAAYLTIRPGLIKGVETYRDHAIASYIHANPGWSSVSGSGHPFWHSAYIGLGYLPNRWGIIWKDQSAEAAVHRVDPKAPYLSARYSSILEHRYFHILRSDPGFVLRTYATKAGVEANQALRRFLSGLVLLPALLLFGRRRRLLAGWALLVLPTLAIQFAAPILTLPGVYGVGFLSAVGLLALLPGCELLALLERTFAARRTSEATVPERATLRGLVREPRAWGRSARQRSSWSRRSRSTRSNSCCARIGAGSVTGRARVIAASSKLPELVRRAVRKPPRVLARRLLDEAGVELERVLAPRRAAAFDDRSLLRATGSTALDDLWERAVGRAPFAREAPSLPEAERARVLAAAEDAVARRVDLLGTGAVAARPGDRLAPGRQERVRMAARLRAAHRVREPRADERRQGSVGDLTRALAPAGRAGVPADGRRAVRRSGTRRARRVDRRKPVRGHGQLVGDDGGRAADSLVVVAPRRARAQRGVARRGLPQPLPAWSLAARRLHTTPPSNAPT